MRLFVASRDTRCTVVVPPALDWSRAKTFVEVWTSTPALTVTDLVPAGITARPEPENLTDPATWSAVPAIGASKWPPTPLALVARPKTALPVSVVAKRPVPDPAPAARTPMPPAGAVACTARPAPVTLARIAGPTPAVATTADPVPVDSARTAAPDAETPCTPAPLADSPRTPVPSPDSPTTPVPCGAEPCTPAPLADS